VRVHRVPALDGILPRAARLNAKSLGGTRSVKEDGVTGLMIFLVAASALLPSQAVSPSNDTRDAEELRRLETVWNEAHVRGDATALAALWDDELTVVVPEMPLMTRAELLAFWRSGRSAITRHETSDLVIRVYESAGVVTGRLRRDRNFNSQSVHDDWRFLKVYVRRGGAWKVVAYQATMAPTK
jgi:hypothetical protein